MDFPEFEKDEGEKGGQKDAMWVIFAKDDGCIGNLGAEGDQVDKGVGGFQHATTIEGEGDKVVVKKSPEAVLYSVSHKFHVNMNWGAGHWDALDAVPPAWNLAKRIKEDLARMKLY
ncbi:hypothetical protein VNO78_00236 [Psophocarpus tetragonolobus]|uniref:Uncharacterized protein n=1 Tax=Psophocarpus tetragonolobus TaxID=3891 RepID=A0AAN9SWY2_PSOTE